MPASLNRLLCRCPPLVLQAGALCSDAPHLYRHPSPPVSSQELRSALLELRALAKGVLPSVAEAGEADFGGVAREVLLPVVGEGEWADDGAPGLGVDLAGCVSVRPLCGRVALPISGDARSRVAYALAVLGAHLAPSEGSKAQLQMLRVVRVILSERPSSLLGLPSQLVYAARQAWHVQGAGADSHMPRGMLALQLGSRHADRVAASTFAAAVGCEALSPLMALQLQLCTHRYSKVRALAQEGYSLALAAHPWMVRKQMLPLIAMLHASEEPHETKAAAFLLASSRIAPRVAHDPHLLCALLAALAKSRDHGRPKVTQRVRLAFSLTLGHVTPPRVTLTLAPPIREPSDAARAARASLEPYYASLTEGRESARRTAFAELVSTAAAGVTSPLTEEEGGGGDKDEATHWSHEVTALSALMVLPARSQTEREAAALVATRALCSPTKAVRNLGRALLFSLLRPPADAAAGPGGTLARLVAGGAVPGLFDDEASGGELWDDVAKGWCVGGAVDPMEVDEDVHTSAPDVHTAEPDVHTAEPDVHTSAPPLGTAAAPLGSASDALLGSSDHLARVLTWLVTDHKEADDTGAPTGGSLAAMAAASAPHEIICLTMGSGRGWPFTLRHGLHGANFALGVARLFERLTAHYGPALGGPLLPAAIPLLVPGAKRDALAVGLEVVGGLLRGSRRWPAADVTALRAQLEPAMSASLRACAVESVGDWQVCLRFVSFSRDPRELGWLAKLLLNGLDSAAAAHETSLAHANALRHLAPLAAELSWRGAPLFERMLGATHTRDAVTTGARQVRLTYMHTYIIM